ncbi:MAG: LysR family transcriptional regulator [Phenylobacterium sp.]|uniref:LysR family transcriptional regulator n=1 Tax=Phenylobacterium sp. TaxID=1871053 RepID=UPI003919A501
MELDWLEDFLALVESAHFSRAAEKRNISQPAFSRRIRMLEDWIGAPLFNRDTHRIVLTPAGEQWRPVAEDVLRRIYLGRERAQEAAGAYTATLKFASTHALSVIFFPQWLERTEAEQKLGVGVSLATDNMAGCEQKMLQGQAQFLLCHHHPSAQVSFKPNYFIHLDIGRDTLAPVSAPDPSGEGPLYQLPGTMDRPLPHLAYSQVSGMGRILAATSALDGPSAWLTPAFTAHLATVLAMMTRSGRGVAWLPLSLVGPDLETGALVRAGGQEWDVPIGVRLYRPRARQSPAAERFWSIVKAMNEQPAEG